MIIISIYKLHALNVRKSETKAQWKNKNYKKKSRKQKYKLKQTKTFKSYFFCWIAHGQVQTVNYRFSEKRDET